jgi:hypothetical protein
MYLLGLGHGSTVTFQDAAGYLRAGKCGFRKTTPTDVSQA